MSTDTHTNRSDVRTIANDLHCAWREHRLDARSDLYVCRDLLLTRIEPLLPGNAAKRVTPETLFTRACGHVPALTIEIVKTGPHGVERRACTSLALEHADIDTLASELSWVIGAIP
jgi:hypothetical protein